jgi:hypothetical protein
MATYYTQDATVGADVNRFYGTESKHNHDTATQFSTAIKEILKVTYGKNADIRMGHFASNQSKIPTGGKRVVELKFKTGGWTNS